MNSARALILLLLAPSAAFGFEDPTRPPGAATAAAAPGAEAPAPTRLESVLIAPDRRIAVISGQQVRPGGRVGDATVVSITEGAVVLRGPGGLETLRLFPNVAKRGGAGERRTPR